MARKDEAVENFDDYLDGWFFRRPGMERMLDASQGEKAAKKAFDENFAALNDKMGGAAESQGGLKDVTDRRRMMLDTVEKENAPKIAEIDGKIKAHNDVVANLSKVESNSAVMMAQLDDASRRVDDEEKAVSEVERQLNEARSEREIRMRYRRHAGMGRGVHTHQEAQGRVRRLALAHRRAGREDGVVVRRVEPSRKCG